MPAAGSAFCLPRVPQFPSIVSALELQEKYEGATRQRRIVELGNVSKSLMSYFVNIARELSFRVA